MNNKSDCHPDTPESGQQTITLENRRNLTDVARFAEALMLEAQTARLASYYNDNKRSLHALNQARIYAERIIEKLNPLPPTEDFPRK